MNRKLLVAALVAGVAVPMAALPLFRLTPAGAGAKDSFKARQTATVKTEAESYTLPAAGLKAPAKIVTSFNEDLSEIEKYGELELMVSEDFSRLTKGSEAEPNEENILHYFDNDPRYEYPWNNMLPELTETPGWGVGSAYAAGGCLYFNCFDSQAHINTPILDLTGEGGDVAVLEFKAKTSEGNKYDYLMVEAAETHHWAKIWDINESIMLSGITDEWHTIRLIFQNCGPSFLFNIVGVNVGEVFIDDVKVYKMKPYLHIPQPTCHTLYNGTDFTANWEAAKGVDQYVVNVYDMESDGKTIHEYLVKDEIVEGTSYKVENALSGKTYYYTVASYKDGVTGLASLPKEVTDLETPKMEPVTLNGEFGYTAKWNLVPGAEVYDYLGYYKREAEQDGEFVVVNENFDKLLYADGSEPEWTKEGVQNGVDYDLYYSKYFPKQMTQKGWYALNAAPFKGGYLSLAGHYYGANKWDNVALISPELDLSKDGGKVTVNMDLAGQEVIYQDEDGTSSAFVETAAVVLYNWNDEKEDYDQVELVYVDRDSKGNPLADVKPVGVDWNNYTVTMTKGSSRSVIGIYAIWGISNLYLDNLKITQNYKKGEYLLDPYFYANYLGVNYTENGQEYIEGGNTVDVEIPGYATGTDVYHSVCAIRAGLDPDPGRDRTVFCTSQYTDKEFVRTTISGVESVEMDNDAVVSVNGSLVTVDNPAGADIRVYGLDGTVLFSSNDDNVSYTLPAKGTYVVACGKRAVKVVF